MLDKELEASLNDAFKTARLKRHEFMTIEHLLLALLSNESCLTALKACASDIEKLRRELEDFVDSSTPLIDSAQTEKETQPTLGFQRVLQRAVFHVQSSGKSEVSGANVLVAIFSEQESQAVYFLKLQNISRIDVVNFMSHGIPKSSEHELETDEGLDVNQDGSEKASALENYASNLNARAKKGEIDPLIGRTEEVNRLSQILVRRRKNNPLLVGDAGVGKTAIVEGLAKRIVDGDVPDVLLGATIYSLDMGALLAGTKYRGDFEKRFKSLLASLKKQPDSVLFIDEIHTIIGAGAASGGVMDASNLLKPMLSSGELRCIGSTTFSEFRGIFEKDSALTRRFQKIDVAAPSIDDTYKILKGLKSNFEEHHKLRYTDKALKAAAELSDRYISDRNLPDKAIDVIDEVGALQQLLPASRRKKVINVGDIEKVISVMAQIPAKTVSSDDKQLLFSLQDKLSMVIFGQDPAVETLSNAIKLSRAGLSGNDKPIGSFLFTGPTGVGKTEITKQLANVMGMELVRFDMSEYMERHTVSRLIGAPPGYVGFDQGGLLTEAVKKTPHCVLLLDEIEKAHPDVFNLLLQVMDNGTLTDNNGRTSDFRNVILIMTSNAGAQEMSRSSIGFTKQVHTTDGMEVVKKTFSPEFRNRLDAIVPFAPLGPDTILHVVNKLLDELQGQLNAQGVLLTVSDKAKQWLGEHGYDETMGARPMARLIQEKIKKPLAEMILFEQAMNKEVLIDTQGDELSIVWDEQTEMA